MSLLRSSGLPREIVALVSQKYTLAVSVTQKSLSQRNISFQVNAIETFFGRQNSVPHDTRAQPILPISMGIVSGLDNILAEPARTPSAVNIPELPITAEEMPKKQTLVRPRLRQPKRKESETMRRMLLKMLFLPL